MRRLTLVLLVLALSGTVAGCVERPASKSDEGAEAESDAPWQRLYVFDGELHAAKQAITFPFDVPSGAQEVEALLTWRAPGAQLGFRLLGPDGQAAAVGWNEGEGRSYVTTTHPVVPGPWRLEVTAALVALAPFAATVTVHSQAVDEGPIAATIVVPARNPARALPPEVRGELPASGPRDFAEVNLNMDPGDWFRFAWNATAPVYFNVHFHGADGTTQRPIEERAAASTGRFTANATEVYALLWRNEGDGEVAVTFGIEGAYRLHSMTRRT